MKSPKMTTGDYYLALKRAITFNVPTFRFWDNLIYLNF